MSNVYVIIFFFFKQKTAYEMRISDWSSDVCSSDLLRDTSSPKSDISDNIINSEVEKLLRNKRHAIQNGYAPKWENHISVYQMEVPKEFARDFRQIRNRTAHADLRRAAPENHPTMGEFYKRYHGYVYILYAQTHWLWHVDRTRVGKGKKVAVRRDLG